MSNIPADLYIDNTSGAVNHLVWEDENKQRIFWITSTLDGETMEKMLEKLSGGCSANLKISSVQQAAEIFAPNGENIASYNSLGGGWTDIQTKAEHDFFSESASVYLQAYREARAEMQSSQPAPSIETSVNIRA